MDVYLAPIVCAIGAWIVQIRRNRQLDLLALAGISLLIILVIGLRYYADIDYPLYVEMYHDNPTLGGFTPSAITALYGEPGYLFITAVFKSLDTGFGIMTLACAIVAITLKAITLARFSRHASLALCGYLCIHFQTNEFIQLRWAVATGLIVLGFSYEYRRQFAKAALCFVTAITIHYFSVVFALLALILPWVDGHKRFYFLFGISVALAVVLKNDTLAPLLSFNSNIYVLARIARYAENPASPLGLFSFAKLAMYVIIYAACVRWRPAYPWRQDPLNVFLFKLALLSICLTFAVTFQPVLHYRATVIADFFAIVLVLNALSIACERRIRVLAFAGLTALFATWYLFDLRNNVAGGRLLDFHTWVVTS